MDIKTFIKNIKLSKEEKKTLSGIGGNTRARGKIHRKILTKKILIDFILKQRLTINEITRLIRSKIKITNTTLAKIAREYNIKINNIYEQNSRKDIQQKRTQTFKKRYGVYHPLAKNSPFYKKRNKTVKNKYGVRNVFQLKDIKDKSKNTLIQKYGVSHPIYLPNRKNNNGKYSKCHQKIEQILKNLGITFESEYGTTGQFRKYNRKLKREYSPVVDIIIKNHHLVIEIYGDTFHARPKLYKDANIIKRWDGYKTAKEIRNFDRSRKRQIESFGYKVLEIWTGDIRSNIKKVKNKINNCLKLDR